MVKMPKHTYGMCKGCIQRLCQFLKAFAGKVLAIRRINKCAKMNSWCTDTDKTSGFISSCSRGFTHSLSVGEQIVKKAPEKEGLRLWANTTQIRNNCRHKS
jgi:hypothetical protein